MKKIFLSIIVANTPFFAIGKANCTIRAVLDESQFFLKDFQNVSDGFVFEISQYRFFFNSNESTHQRTVRIQTLINNKEFSTTESLNNNYISVEAIEQGRELASFLCRTN